MTIVNDRFPTALPGTCVVALTLDRIERCSRSSIIFQRLPGKTSNVEPFICQRPNRADSVSRFVLVKRSEDEVKSLYTYDAEGGQPRPLPPLPDRHLLTAPDAPNSATLTT